MYHFLGADRAPEAEDLITGNTLGNNTLDQLAAFAKPAKPSTRVVPVLPTATLIPDAFLNRGCHIIGGVKVAATIPSSTLPPKVTLASIPLANRR